MNIPRAEEILNSLGVIEVFYHGSPVWLEQVDGESVKIKDLNTQTDLQVTVNELMER